MGCLKFSRMSKGFILSYLRPYNKGYTSIDLSITYFDQDDLVYNFIYNFQCINPARPFYMFWHLIVLNINNHIYKHHSYQNKKPIDKKNIYVFSRGPFCEATDRSIPLKYVDTARDGWISKSAFLSVASLNQPDTAVGKIVWGAQPTRSLSKAAAIIDLEKDYKIVFIMKSIRLYFSNWFGQSFV